MLKHEWPTSDARKLYTRSLIHPLASNCGGVQLYVNFVSVSLTCSSDQIEPDIVTRTCM